MFDPMLHQGGAFGEVTRPEDALEEAALGESVKG